MKNLTPYLLLAALCINLFGASVGELAHMAAHLTEGTHLQWHSHQHETTGTTGHDHHTHHEAISFLLAFDTGPQGHPLKDLLHLNLLMLVIDGIINDNTLQLGIPIAQQHQSETLNTLLKSTQQDIPTPPPRFIA